MCMCISYPSICCLSCLMFPQVSTRWSRGGEESAEATLNPRRYFVYLAHDHWTERPPPNDLVALAAERVARILQAPPLFFEWLQRLAVAVASGE